MLGGLRRHHQSVDRRYRRAGAAGARDAGARRRRPERTRAFARYSLIGALAGAAGSLAAATPDVLALPASARSAHSS